MMLRKLLITVSVQECALPVPCARMPCRTSIKCEWLLTMFLFCINNSPLQHFQPFPPPLLIRPAPIPMAPLHRSFSLPVSLSNPVSRLKALSGAAGKDEVSLMHTRGKHSSRSVYVTLVLFMDNSGCRNGL